MGQVLMVGGGGTDTSGVTAIASHVLNPDVFVNSDGQEVTGTMADKSGTNYTVTPSITSSSGYLIMGIPAAGYYGKWVSSSTANRLQWAASNLGNAQPAQVLAGYTFTSRYGLGSEVGGTPAQEGSIPSKAAETKHPVLTNMTDKVNITIAAGQYLSGAQVIRGVTVSDTWTAANIKSGVKISVGDTSSVEALTVRTGTYTNVSSGQIALVASALRSGYSGFANGGSEVRGSMATYTTPTAFTPSQSPITIQVGGKYVSSNLTINAITYPSTFAAGNIKKGVTISIGGKSVTGTFEGYVPGTLDIYKNGSWGTGYGSSNLIVRDPYSASSASPPVVTFNTANFEVRNLIAYANSSFYKGMLGISVNINLTPYSTFNWTEYDVNKNGTTETLYFYNSNTTNAVRAFFVSTINPASYVVHRDNHSYPDTLTNPVQHYYVNSSGTGASEEIASGYFLKNNAARTTNSTFTTSFSLSNINATRYIYYVPYYNILRGYPDNMGYMRVTRIYFT